MYSSSLRLRYRDFDCPIIPGDLNWVGLGLQTGNLDDIDWGGKVSSFKCVKYPSVGSVSFRRERSYSTTCSSGLDAHPHRSIYSCCYLFVLLNEYFRTHALHMRQPTWPPPRMHKECTPKIKVILTG